MSFLINIRQNGEICLINDEKAQKMPTADVSCGQKNDFSMWGFMRNKQHRFQRSADPFQKER